MTLVDRRYAGTRNLRGITQFVNIIRPAVSPRRVEKKTACLNVIGTPSVFCESWKLNRLVFRLLGTKSTVSLSRSLFSRTELERDT